MICAMKGGDGQHPDYTDRSDAILQQGAFKHFRDVDAGRQFQPEDDACAGLALVARPSSNASVAPQRPERLHQQLFRD
jgi:hypothetical protein